MITWRVAILPYIEQGPLYNQFKLDEPWDSEHNKKLVDRMPAIYRSPLSKAEAGKTNYLTVRGKRTVFPVFQRVGEYIKPEWVKDGLSDTIMLVEAADDRAVVWTKPDDFEPDLKDPIEGLLGLYPDGFLACMGDGVVRLVKAQIDPEMLLRAFDRADGKPVDLEKLIESP